MAEARGAAGASHAQLRALLRSLAPIGDDAMAALAPLLQPRKFDAGSWLLRGGEHAHYVYFVAQGLVRELYVGERGSEHTRAFVCEGQVTGSLLDLISGCPSVTWIEALEPTSTLAFEWEAWNRLCLRYPDLQRCARAAAEQVYVKKAKREHDMLTLRARERYAAWLADQPGLDARVSRQQVASYLGITPEHLSRLRRRGTHARLT